MHRLLLHPFDVLADPFQLQKKEIESFFNLLIQFNSDKSPHFFLFYFDIQKMSSHHVQSFLAGLIFYGLSLA